MYAYDWDPETGGYVLKTDPNPMSKEPRPVYAEELDILGFDKKLGWKYPKDSSRPLLWAEMNTYIYKGRRVAIVKGGSVYEAPEVIEIESPEPTGCELDFVDIDLMVEKSNANGILESLVNDTVKKIYNTWKAYEGRVDIFYVAFSGGKDSIVLFDLVRRALPHSTFKVLFGDTGMEFPDTYDIVREIKQLCDDEKIEFISAKSHYSPAETWNLFGPPATTNRWCCSVHKTAPQIIALRERAGKPDFTGMAFIGVRAAESKARSEYEYVSNGEKHKGQYSFNPILDWDTSELFLYIYSNRLPFNNAYIKGNRRVGCLLCPRAAERNEYLCQVSYPQEVGNFVELIRSQYCKKMPNRKVLDEFIAQGGWKARKNGRDITDERRYAEENSSPNFTITVNNPRTDWKVWIKTIGKLVGEDDGLYAILFKGTVIHFALHENGSGYCVTIPERLLKDNPEFVKLFKHVFRKAAYCIMCGVCEADCHNGALNMTDGLLRIDDRCMSCSQCHKVEKGCLVFKSLELPREGSSMNTKSLNCYSHHAPKLDWFEQFFAFKKEFASKHTLGSQMFNFFKRFLKDADLTTGNGFSRTAEIINQLSLKEDNAWAIMLINLSYSPQVNWFVKRIPFDEDLSRAYICSLLVADGARETWASDIWASLGRLVALPFGRIGLGTAIMEKSHFVEVRRNKWEAPTALAVLYSLYRFAEAGGEGYRQFSLRDLMDTSIEREGVSPVELFGLNHETLEGLVKALSVNYPDFISSTFALDLDNIRLNAEKSSKDVLELFVK